MGHSDFAEPHPPRPGARSGGRRLAKSARAKGSRSGVRGQSEAKENSRHPGREPRGARRAAPSDAGIVARLPLIDRLSGDDQGGVVLLCAPAGSGKTELVHAWIRAEGWGDRAGWVSVERGERDAQRFWLSLIGALAGACEVVRPVDPVPQFRGDVVLERLLGELDSLAHPAVLVVDDMHELESADALEWLEVFLGALPPELHVILTTREEPRLGLHRLRLTGRLTDLRGPDLRFSFEEAEDLFRGARVTLSEDGVRLLYERTEGWVAGLRLAAISLARHPDPERFVREFSGSERSVSRYLLDEVLERQPPEVRELLLRMSVLQRAQRSCSPTISRTARAREWCTSSRTWSYANAFVTSLDAGRSWFRYHHLFADLLQLELRRVAPDLVAPLHLAAADWHERHGDLVEAIRHAQAAEDGHARRDY